MVRPCSLWLLALACAPAPGEALPEPTPAACEVAADCEHVNPCRGEPRCLHGTCEPGPPVICDDPDQACIVRDATATCAPLCPLPLAPVLHTLRHDDTLHFVGPGQIETAVLPADHPADDPPWRPTAIVSGDESVGATRVLARTTAETCAPEDLFDHVYAVAPGYPGPAGTAGSLAISKDSPALIAWATGHADLVFGEGVDATWRDPTRAYGPAAGTSTDIVSLGEGGWIALTFDRPIADGPGPDFAVFENSFSDTFLELAYVEVSSDGATFARFDSGAHTPTPIGAFGLTDPTDVHGVAGVYRQGFGTPFDLALLRDHELARTGQLDLARITHVRIVDIVGDGSMHDSFGRPIHDPYPTAGSAGFDLDAVGVLHEAPQ